MSDGSQYVELPGSERQPLAGARRVADAPPDEPVEVTVLLRRKEGDATDAFAAHAEEDPVAREDLSVDQLAARFGAADDDVKKVERFAKDNRLEVVDESAAQRRVRAARPGGGDGGGVRRLARALRERRGAGLPRAGGRGAGPGRAGGRRHGGPGAGRPPAGEAAPGEGRRGGAAEGVRGPGDREVVQLPDGPGERPVGRDHRARRRVPAGRPRHVLQVDRDADADGRGDPGRQGQERPGPGRRTAR